MKICTLLGNLFIHFLFTVSKTTRKGIFQTLGSWFNLFGLVGKFATLSLLVLLSSFIPKGVETGSSTTPFFETYPAPAPMPNNPPANGSGSGTLLDPYVVNSFPYIFTNLNTGNGETAIGMQGTCFTLSCCSVSVFKVTLPSTGTMSMQMLGFTPLAGSMIAYRSLVPNPTSYADLEYIQHSANFCGYRDSLDLGRYWTWARDLSYVPPAGRQGRKRLPNQPIVYGSWGWGVSNNTNVYDFDNPNPVAGFFPAGDYYILVFNENQQSNLAVGTTIDIQFLFQQACSPLTAPSDIAFDTLEPSGTNVDTASFYVKNDRDLLIDIDSVYIAGDDSSQFSVISTIPAVLDTADSILVEVAFTPTSGGAKQSNLTIEFSDTSCSSSNSIALSGLGAFSELTVLGNGSEITNGDNSPSATDNTFIGAGIPLLSTLSKTYQVVNSGFDTLEFTGSPAVQLSNSSEFSVSQQPQATVLPGDTATFEISFSPTAETAFTSTVTIASNDPNSPFNFDVSGEGIPQNALNFDGSNDWVEIDANATVFAGATQLTVEAWIKADPAASGSDRIFAINTSGTGNVILFGLNNGFLNFFDGSDSYEYLGGNDLRDDQWHHVGFSYDDGFLKVYLDGRIVKIDRVNTRTFSSSNRWSIGQEFDGSSRSDYFQGSIDEVRIWGDIRTDAEIANAYLCELTGGEDNLVSYYTFNQGIPDGANGSETNLTDWGPNGFDGTLSNFGLTTAGSNWEAASGVAAGCSSSFELVTDASSLTLNGGSSVTASGIYTDTVGTNFYRYDVEIAFNEVVANTIAGQTVCAGEVITRNITNEAVPALEFNSADQDFVVLDNLADTLAGSNRSVFMWVQVPTGSLSETQYLFAVNRGGTGIESGMFVATNGEYRIYHGSNDYDPNTAINDGQWHHVGYTYDDVTNNTIMYVDGVAVGDFSVDHSIASGDKISLGQEYDNTTSSNHFDGYMSHIGIWGEALSATQVATIYSNSVNLSDSNLISFYPGYRNVNGTNTEIEDVVNGFHGQLSNSAIAVDSIFAIPQSSFSSIIDSSAVTQNGTLLSSTSASVGATGIYNYQAFFAGQGFTYTQNWTDEVSEGITTQPQNSFENVGVDAIFTVGAQGGSTYQWYELEDSSVVSSVNRPFDIQLSGRNVIYGTEDDNFYISNDHGHSFSSLALDTLIWDYRNADSVVAATATSRPSGLTIEEWETEVRNNLLEEYGFVFASFGNDDPPSPRKLAVNGAEVYLFYSEEFSNSVYVYSSDSGKTFIPLPDYEGVNVRDNQFAVAQGTLYAYDENGNISTSTNQGQTWSTTNVGSRVRELKTSRGRVFAMTSTDVFISTDGVNFTSANFGFSVSGMGAMAVKDSSIYISVDNDLIVSKDLGQSWTRLTNKLNSEADKLIATSTELYAQLELVVMVSKDQGRSFDFAILDSENDIIAADNFNFVQVLRPENILLNAYNILSPLTGETNTQLTISAPDTSDEGRKFIAEVNTPDACDYLSNVAELLIDPCTGSPSFNTITTNSCGGYAGPSGFIYTQSGTYVDTLVNANATGCDSIITLNLTIFPAVATGETRIDSCGQITFNGNVYENSITLVDTFLNGAASGCDSLHFTILTVYRFPAPEEFAADLERPQILGVTDSAAYLISRHDPAVGNDLYIYDGDTLISKDLGPGIDFSGISLGSATVHNNELYYGRFSSGSTNLYKLDANHNEIQLSFFVSDDNIQFITITGNKIYFVRGGSDINYGTQIWVIEGNNSPVQIDNSTANATRIRESYVVEDFIYFSARGPFGDEFLKLDTRTNTMQFIDLHPGTNPLNSDELNVAATDIVVFNTKLFFEGALTGSVRVNSDGDTEYRSDRQFLVLDTNDQVSILGDKFEDPYIFQGNLYYRANNDSGDETYFRYDGASSTELYNPLRLFSTNYTEYNGDLYIAAGADGLFKISGDSVLQVSSDLFLGEPVALGGELYFIGDESGLYRYDGNRVLRHVYDLNAYTFDLFYFQNNLYFFNQDEGSSSTPNDLFVVPTSGFNFNPQRTIITSCGDPVVFQGETFFGDTILYDTTTSIASHACDSIYVTQIIFDSVSVELNSTFTASCEACANGRITASVVSTNSTSYDYIFSTGDSILESSSSSRQVSSLFSDTYSVTVSSEYGCSSTDTAFVPFNGPPNQAPIAQDDFFSVFKGDTLIAFPLNNDNEPDNNGMTVTLLSLPDSGTAYISPVSNAILRRDTLYYIGTPTFFGFEQFEYAVCDPINFCDTATITIEVKNNTGTALNFDGSNDYVDINAVAPAFGVVDSFTIEAWIKADSTQSGDDVIVGVNAPGTGTRTQLNTFLGDGTLEIFADGQNLRFQSGDLRDEQWHHIAISYDGTRFSGYVDGELIGQIIESIDPFSTSDRWSIGQEYDGSSTSNFWAGDINEVRIWNTLRTPAQIQNQMNCALKGDESGLVAYYQFDQGLLNSDNSSVTTLTDLTANAANGTLNNFALIDSVSNWVEGNVIYENCEILRTCENVDFSTPSGGAYSASGEYFEILSDVQNRDSVVFVEFEKNFTEIDLARLADDTLCLGESAAYSAPVNNHIQYLSFTQANEGYVNLDVLVDSLVNTDRSIFLWMKQSTTVAGDFQTLVGINSSGTATVTNLLIDTDEDLDTYDGSSYQTTNTVVTDGIWHHVGYTYNEATNETKIYIDGVVKDTYTNGQSISSGARISLGQEFDGAVASNFFEGEMSQIAFYNKVITDAEVVSLFNAAPDSTEISEMLAFYPGHQICGGVGEFLEDVGPNGLHGLMTRTDIIQVDSVDTILNYNASNLYQNQWEVNGSVASSGSSVSINPASAGTSTVDLTMSGSGVAFTDGLEALVSDLPTVDIINSQGIPSNEDVVCVGEPITLSANTDSANSVAWFGFGDTFGADSVGILGVNPGETSMPRITASGSKVAAAYFKKDIGQIQVYTSVSGGPWSALTPNAVSGQNSFYDLEYINDKVHLLHVQPTGEIFLKEYNGTWNTLGGQISMGTSSIKPTVLYFNNEIHVAYNLTNAVKVQKLVAGSWQDVGTISVPNSDVVDLFEYNGQLACLLLEYTFGTPLNNFKTDIYPSVYTYDGSTWNSLGNTKFSGTSITNNQFYSQLVYNGNLFVAYADEVSSDKAVVKMYDGSNWVDAGQSPVTSNDVREVQLIEVQNSLYLLYIDDVTDNIQVKKWNGSTWDDALPINNVATARFSAVSLGTSLQVLTAERVDTISSGPQIGGNIMGPVLHNYGIVYGQIGTGPTVEINKSGDFTAQVTNPFGCVSTLDSIAIRDTFKLEMQSVDISCNGANDGSVTAADCGLDSVIYIWNTGDSTQTISGLAAGSYSVTVASSNQDTLFGSATIIEPAPVVADIIQGDTAYLVGDSVQLSVNPVAGVNYQWFANESQDWGLAASTTTNTTNIFSPVLAVNAQGEPIVAYRDDINGQKITVTQFDGSSWQNVGSSSFSDSVFSSLDLAVDNNNVPYVAYSNSQENRQITVERFNGAVWVKVGSVASSGTGRLPVLAFNQNNTPYVCYIDSAGALSVKAFNSSTWSFVGIPSFTDLTTTGFDFKIASDNTPYVAYGNASNGNQVYVSKFDGTNWVDVGQQPVSTNNMGFISIDFDSQNMPYIAHGAGFFLFPGFTVQKFDGSNWAILGTENFKLHPDDQLLTGKAELMIDPQDNLFVGYKETGWTSSFEINTVLKFNEALNDWDSTGYSIPFNLFADPSFAMNSKGDIYALDYYSNFNIAFDIYKRTPRRILSSQPLLFADTLSTFIVAATNTNGCAAYDTIYVDTLPPCVPSFDALALDLVNHASCDTCADGALAINFTNPTSTYTYDWGNGETTATAVALSPGVYTVTITDTAGCVYTETGEIFDQSSFFITRWNTRNPAKTDSLTVEIPARNTTSYRYDIDWDGDGIFDEFQVFGTRTHVYPSAGTYTINIKGNFGGWSFRTNNTPFDDANKLVEVVQWGAPQWSTMRRAFTQCDSLVITASDAPDLSQATSLEDVFYLSENFNSDVSNWDVSTIENFARAFRSCQFFNQDLSSWDVSNGTDFNSMFFSAKAFNSDISGWDMSNATTLERMFQSTDVFNQDISSWNVQNVANFEYMFFNAKAFNQNIGNWNTHSATEMQAMFSGAEEFNQDLSAWDVDSVELMFSMFSNAKKFNQNLNTWDVSNVTNMRSMFSNAEVFNGDISSWDVSKVQGMRRMFNKASKFNQDISGWNVSSVTDMDYMFGEASDFNQDIGNWDVSSVTNMEWMFLRAYDFNQDLRNWDVSSVTDMSLMFSLSGFDQNIGMWDMDSVADVTRMFRFASLSTSNYDSILIGWAAQNLVPNLNFHGGNSNYCLGDSARQYLIDSLGWTIEDDGKFCGPPSVSIVLDANESCFGSEDGSATASVSGGTEPYNFTWSSGDTTATLTAGAGTYFLTVTDAQAQQAFDTVTITSPTAIVLSNTQVQPDCGANNGSVDITPTGGAGGYTFAWSNSATTEDITNVPAGQYTVTITDANSCTSAPSVNVSNANGITVTSSAVDLVCRGDSTGSISLTVSGGTPSYSYAWSNGATTQNISNLPSGFYTVSVTDQGGCLTVLSDTIERPERIVASADAIFPTCAEDSNGLAWFRPISPAGAYTFQWFDGTTGDTVRNLPQNFIVNVTITQVSTGCTIEESIPMWPIPVLNVSAQVDSNVSCNGNANGQASVQASGGRGSYTYAWSNGSTEPFIDSLSPNKYFVSVTDINGCVKTDSVEIIEPTSLTLAAALIQDVSCAGGADGSAEVTVSGGTMPYNFMWSDSMMTMNDTLADAQAGVYTIVVEDANGCSDSATATINQPSLIFSASSIQACFGDTVGQFGFNILSDTVFTDTLTSANGCDSIAQVTVNFTPQLSRQFVKTNLSCFGETNGSANIIASGGTAPYSYTWESGSTTVLEDSLAAGFESVTITDANNCQLIDSVLIEEPTFLQATITVTQEPSCFGGDNGFATAVGTGGTMPYVYTWSQGSSTEQVNNLSAGAVSVTITDANGCDAVATTTLGQPAELIATAQQDSAVSCFGFADGVATASVVNNIGFVQYAWSNGASGATQNNLSAGTYTITVTDFTLPVATPGVPIITVPSCTTTTTVTITEPDSFIVDFVTLQNVSCNGGVDGQVSIDFEGGTSPYLAYAINGDTNGVAGNSFPFFNDTTATTPALSVFYDFTDANGCVAGDSVIVTEPSILSASFNSTDASCFGFTDGSSTVNASGGTMPYTYAWENGSTDTIQTGLAAGYETVTITDANNCELIDSVLISEPSFLQATITVTQEPSCFGGDNGFATAVGTGGTMPYVYSWSQGSSTEQVNNLSAGAVSVTITDANGCSATSTSTLNEPAELIATAQQDTAVSCYGLADGVASAAVSGGIGFQTFAWSNGSFGAVQNNLAAGTYTITVTDQLAVSAAPNVQLVFIPSCSTTTTVTITEPDSLELSLTETASILCAGDATGEISAVGQGGTMPYLLTWSQGSSTTGNIGNLVADGYNITLTDANGCFTSGSITLNEPSPLALSFNSTNASCFGFTDGSSTVNVSGGIMPYTYAWENGDTTQTAMNLGAGFQSVTVTDANGCTIVDSVEITEPTQLGITLTQTAQVACEGDTTGRLEALGSGGTSPYTFVWSTGDVTDAAENLGAGIYVATVTDDNGCALVDSIQIDQESDLSLALTKLNDISCFGANDGAAEVSVGNANYNISYAWSNAETTDTAMMLVPGWNVVTVTESFFGVALAPNTFSPNDFFACEYVDSVLIVEPALLTDSVVVEFCQGSSVMLPSGTQRTTAGLQIDTLTASNGCDSVVTYNLIENPTYFAQASATICQGEFFTTVGNQVLSNAGIYYDTLQTISGCDSVIETSLTVNPVYFTQATITICDNESYTTEGGQQLTSAGVYYDTLQTVNGCDSIFETVLIVNPTYVTQVSPVICDNESYLSAGGQQLTTAGIYYDTLQTTAGCDSVIETTLQVNPTYFVQASATICANQNYTTPAGNVVNSTGIYTDTLQTVNGCDSVVQIDLTVNPVYFTVVQESICQGDTFLSAGNQQLTMAGVYNDTLQTVNGCDSVIETTINILPLSFTTGSLTICDGDSAMIHGVMQFTQGSYTQVYTGANGCDSTSTISLFVNPVFNPSQSFTICEGDSALIDGLFRFTSGTFTENYQTVNGCDSIIDIDLTVVPRAITLDTAFICIGDSMMIAGAFRTEEGLYADTLQYTAGCDSVIRNTQLLFFEQPSLSLTQVGDICETEDAVSLTGMPMGGTFSGAGVTGSSFDPTVTSVGIHPITYTYTDANSCTYSISEDAIVRANPIVNIGEFDNPLCLELQLVACPNATPAGGTYFGAGVDGVIFDMTQVGVGTFPVGYTYTNQFGCTSADSTTIEIEKCFDDATGITQAFSNANESLVYPNPNEGRFTIQHNYTEEITAVIIDQNGRLVHQINNLPIVQQIDISGLPAGLYHVQLIGKHTNKGHRIIIH